MNENFKYCFISPKALETKKHICSHSLSSFLAISVFENSDSVQYTKKKIAEMQIYSIDCAPF